MKWIGQHIYDFVSRFRSDVYLEDISTGTIASGGNLGLDSNNKIVKDDGDGVTDLHGAGVDGSNNQLLTDDGDGTVTSEANLTFDGSTLSVEADSNTTANALFIDANSLTTGSAITIDVDDALTTTNTKSLAKINYDKSGVIGALNTANITGLEIALNDDATNNGVGGSHLKGIDVKIDYDNATGAQRPVGVKIEVAKDGTVDALNGKGTGWETTVNNGGLDFRCYSSANDNTLSGDFSSWATTTNGATTITTVDYDAALAHFEISADGDITLDAAGQIKLEPVAGNNILLDGTIQIDAGVVTGATSITSTAFVGTLSTASQPNITTVGTIGTGVWQGTAIAQAYIAGDAINGDKIADDAVDSEHYTDGSIDTAHIGDDQVTFAKVSGVVPRVYGSIIKLLPTDFEANEDGGATKTMQFDDTAPTGLKPGSDATELLAFASIPEGMKATHVDIYAGQDLSMECFELDINASGLTSKGSGTTNTTLDITDVNSTATNYLMIMVTTTATSNRVWGGQITIAAQ